MIIKFQFSDLGEKKDFYHCYVKNPKHTKGGRLEVSPGQQRHPPASGTQEFHPKDTPWKERAELIPASCPLTPTLTPWHITGNFLMQ